MVYWLRCLRVSPHGDNRSPCPKHRAGDRERLLWSVRYTVGDWEMKSENCMDDKTKKKRDLVKTSYILDARYWWIGWGGGGGAVLKAMQT